MLRRGDPGLPKTDPRSGNVIHALGGLIRPLGGTSGARVACAASRVRRIRAGAGSRRARARTRIHTAGPCAAASAAPAPLVEVVVRHGEVHGRRDGAVVLATGEDAEREAGLRHAVKRVHVHEAT